VTFVAPTCRVEPPPGAQEFACGGELVRVTPLDPNNACAVEFPTDSNGNFIPDEEGRPAPVRGSPNQTVQVSFYYRSPSTGSVDEGSDTPDPNDMDDIQGLSMAIAYNVGLKCLGTHSIAGTITEAVGAEFVSVHCKDNGPAGGGSLVIGILVDALPPFDGQTLPPTANLLKVIGVDFSIDAGVACGNPVPILFNDGQQGAGQVPIKNLISVMNMPIAPKLCNCDVQVLAVPEFVRGDCNFKESNTAMEVMAVDISDAAAVISFLFLTGSWKFHPVCLDACDANDDGRIDLADSVAILRYLFKFGAVLPTPGPTASGIDPTGDKLDCKGGARCD
jgi:hypothetical protein